jgi:ribosome maturation factor RimP
MPPAPAGRSVPGSSTGQASAARQDLLDLLGPVVSATGHDLEDVTITSAGRRNLVRVVVDADGGVDLDAVADVSRAVSVALDGAADAQPGGVAFAGSYVLEVSSPGVDRPLTEPRHWRRAVGRLVRVTVAEHELTGRVVAASESTVTLDVAGEHRELPMAELGRGRVQVEFNRGGPGEG